MCANKAVFFVIAISRFGHKIKEYNFTIITFVNVEENSLLDIALCFWKISYAQIWYDCYTVILLIKLEHRLSTHRSDMLHFKPCTLYADTT
jgi:hypothetical protein